MCEPLARPATLKVAMPLAASSAAVKGAPPSTVSVTLPLGTPGAGATAATATAKLIALPYVLGLADEATDVVEAPRATACPPLRVPELGLKATYAWTPALSMGGGVSAHLTHRAVDTDGTPVAGAGLMPNFAKNGGEGDSVYIGTELHGNATWRFAPGLALDAGIGYLIAGSAMDAFAQPNAQGNRDAKDIFIATTRVRFTF